MSSRTDVAEAKEATGRRIARRVWGPMKKQVSDTIGAPAAVASVLLQPMYIPCELVHKVHALVPAEVGQFIGVDERNTKGWVRNSSKVGI